MKFNKMDRKIKRKWLKALRSGRYKQGRGTLRSASDKFCCLGVLCDVMDPKKWGPNPGENNAFRSYSYGASQADAVMPPESACRRAKLDSKGGGSATVELADMNDEKRNRFSTIANWIEENL